MEITKVAAVLWLLCTVPLLAEIVPLHSNSAHYIDTENEIPNKGFDDYEANAFTPEEGVAPAPAAAQGPKPPPATARKMNRKLQQSNLDTSASNLATIFSFFDNAPPGLIPADMIAPEEEEAISAAALAPAAAPKPAAAPNLAPAAPTKSAAAPKKTAVPRLAPAPAPSKPRVSKPRMDTVATSDLMSLFAGYRDSTSAEKAPQKTNTGRQLLSWCDFINTPAKEAVIEARLAALELSCPDCPETAQPKLTKQAYINCYGGYDPQPAQTAQNSNAASAQQFASAGRKLQEGFADSSGLFSSDGVFSAKNLEVIYGQLDNAPPGLIPSDILKNPAAWREYTQEPEEALVPAPAQHSKANSARKLTSNDRKLQEGFKDIFTPAELQAMFGTPEEEGDSAKAQAPAAGAGAAAAGRPAPAAPKARGRQLLQPMSLEEQLVWRAVKKSLVDTEAEQAQADFDQVIEQIAEAAAPGPAGADSASRRRMLQDYNSPDFPRKIFDLAFQLAPNHGPVRPEAADAPEYHLVPEAIPTRGLLQDDQSNYSALEDIVSLPDTVLPVAVEVKGPEAESALAPAPVPAGKALTGEPAPSVEHGRSLQQTDPGFFPAINPDTIGANFLMGIADNLKTFLNANQDTQVQATESASATAPTSGGFRYFSNLNRPSAEKTATPPAKAPKAAEAPEEVGALLKGAPVAAPLAHLPAAHHAAKAPAASESIIITGPQGPHEHAPVPAPGDIGISISGPSIADILRRLNHTQPLKVAHPPKIAPSPNTTAKSHQVFKQAKVPRKTVFSATNAKAFFALAPEAFQPSSEELLPAKLPQSVGVAPAPYEGKAAQAPSALRRLLQGSDATNASPYDLAKQAAAVKADFDKFEAKQLQAQGAGSFPGRSGEVLPPDNANHSSVSFPGTVPPGAPLTAPPPQIGQRGNPAPAIVVPVVAPAPGPGSAIGSGAPFPGSDKGPGLPPAPAPSPKVYLDA